MRQLPNLPLELLQSQTILDLSDPFMREEFRQSLMQIIDQDDLSSVRDFAEVMGVSQGAAAIRLMGLNLID